MTRLVLIVEGEGDVAAAPKLIHRILACHQITDFHIHPAIKRHTEIPKLRKPGKLEAYVRHALNEDGDSVLLLLDCEDDCPVAVAREFCQRIHAMTPRVDKKIGISFLHREFETLFLHCLPEIARALPDYGWLEDAHDRDKIPCHKRDAKGTMSKLMKSGKAYKETTEQARFVLHLDFSHLRTTSRPFRHLEFTLLWLAGQRDSSGPVYPGFV